MVNIKKKKSLFLQTKKLDKYAVLQRSVSFPDRKSWQSFIYNGKETFIWTKLSLLLGAHE